MTTTAKPAKTVKPAKKSQEQILASLREKQKALGIKASRIEKDIEERRNSASQAQRIKVGKLAEEAGILGLPEAVLTKAFAEIAAKNGVKTEVASPLASAV